ncbi:MAG: aspartate--tRNA(Asn) ligase [Candidatus Marsarchaeota archaeon]|nr:aspartate--tRNA(Asn) ligase [Candidatus Marsarchaeota archaeon]
MLRNYFINDLNESLDGKEVVLAGWVHEVRALGKITFLILRDKTGLVQVIGKAGITDKSILDAMNLPKESVIQLKGLLKINKEAKRGFEIQIIDIKNLNPIASLIPFEVTGKVDADQEVRLDFRYIDLRRIETTAIFDIQSVILDSFRSSLSSKGFQEIRTPCMVEEATEGGADLFSISYFDKKAYLAQSPQLYKQLAVIGGMDKVFTVSPVFRAEKSNTSYHLTEITQMDIEMGFSDHNDAMHILSEVFIDIITNVKNKNKRSLEILGMDLQIPNINTITYLDAIEKLKETGMQIKFGDDFNREAEAEISNIFGDAVIIKDFPTELRAFYSMPHKDDPKLCNSFDLIYKGLEISSGAQRIHEKELLNKVIINRGMDPKKFEFYTNAMGCGAPPHAGWSIGLERLTMKLTGQKNIREASLFPRDPKRLKP